MKRWKLAVIAMAAVLALSPAGCRGKECLTLQERAALWSFKSRAWSSETTLHYAAAEGRLNICRHLLEAEPALLNAKDDKGQTPLHWAAWAGHREVCDFLIHKGAPTDIFVESALGRLPELEALLSADPNLAGAKQNDDFTPLHVAADKNLLEVCELLIQKGAPVNAEDNNGWTPLHWAARVDNPAVCELLIQNGAEINLEDKSDWTPLHHAAWFGHREVCELLIHKGAHTDIFIESALGRLPEVESLLSADPDLAGAKLNEHYAPLYWAARWGHREVCELLIQNGAEINVKDILDWTPLHWAASVGHPEVCELLIQHGAQVNAKDFNHYTPLHQAASEGHLEVCEVLIQHGALVNARDSIGRTPLHLARWKYPKIANLLRRHGGVK